MVVYREFHFVSVIVLAAGCSASTKVTPTGSKQPPRERGCQFKILTALPAAGYVEVATVDYNAPTIIDSTKNLSEFREKIANSVCHAGGDAAVAIAEEHGYYIKATVLKAVATTRSQNAGGRSPETSLESAGCKFDTQCKGERICVGGSCVDPPGRSPSSDASTDPE